MALIPPGLEGLDKDPRQAVDRQLIMTDCNKINRSPQGISSDRRFYRKDSLILKVARADQHDKMLIQFCVPAAYHLQRRGNYYHMTSSCLLFGTALPSCGHVLFTDSRIISALKGIMWAHHRERPMHNTAASQLDKDAAEGCSPSHSLGSEFSESAGQVDNS